jgi:hypothetical protein
MNNSGLMKICRGCGGRVPKNIVDSCPLCNGSKGFLLDGGIIEKATNVENIEKPYTISESEELQQLRKENTELKNKLKNFEIIRKEVQKKQEESIKPKKKEEKKSNIKSTKEYNQRKSMGLKIPIMIGIPILILIILGGVHSQGLFDNDLENQVIEDTTKIEVDSKDSNDKEVLSTVTNSKCGKGTIFDEDTNSCVLEK